MQKWELSFRGKLEGRETENRYGWVRFAVAICTMEMVECFADWQDEVQT